MKLEFLPIFKAVFKALFIKRNIESVFRGASLVPLDLDLVISKLNIRIRTPPRAEAIPIV